MTVHQFAPDHYHTAIGTYEPVLRIASGDTVETSTVDSGGLDKHWASPSPPAGIPRRAPSTSRAPRRGTSWRCASTAIAPTAPGHTSALVAPHVVDPGFVAELPRERGRGHWEIDVERWTATLAEPETALGRLTIPLDPMIGCFGVAPAARAGHLLRHLRARTAGNMDYRGFRQGVTVYFPVFVEGALFHLGDGHATQGDGEITAPGPRSRWTSPSPPGCTASSSRSPGRGQKTSSS